MSMVTSIANASISLQNAKMAQELSVAMTKKVMDVTKENSNGLIEMMQKAVPPQSGFHARA